MKKEFVVTVDSDVYEKFCIALTFANDEQNQTIERCIKQYIVQSFEKVSRAYSAEPKPTTLQKATESFYGMANRRIPKWALETKQYNHKIIRAFFKVEQENGKVSKRDMERACGDSSVPELYVPTFQSNYAQMKFDSQRNHGKVFEDDGETVAIWLGVADTLIRYKNFFSDSSVL